MNGVIDCVYLYVVSVYYVLILLVELFFYENVTFSTVLLIIYIIFISQVITNIIITV